MRLLLAMLCTLMKRYEEAIGWFADARVVLDEQGARPMRAIVDLSEAQLYTERDEPGDGERALTLIEVAMQQFMNIGMTIWTLRAEELRAAIGITDVPAP